METRPRAESILSNVPAVFYSCECSSSWKMYYMSDGITAITGHKPSEFINKDIHTFSIIIHTDDKKRVEDVVFKAVDERKPYSVQYRILDKENNIHWVIDKGTAIYDKDDEVVWLEGVIIEINEFQMMIQSQQNKIEKLENTLNHIKKLSGRISLCTKCGKTKGEQENWVSMEKYIEKNSEAIFNHEICPDCKKELYGGHSWFEGE